MILHAAISLTPHDRQPYLLLCRILAVFQGVELGHSVTPPSRPLLVLHTTLDACVATSIVSSLLLPPSSILAAPWQTPQVSRNLTFINGPTDDLRSFSRSLSEDLRSIPGSFGASDGY
jgi:hypothetical protein